MPAGVFTAGATEGVTVAAPTTPAGTSLETRLRWYIRFRYHFFTGQRAACVIAPRLPALSIELDRVEEKRCLRFALGLLA